MNLASISAKDFLKIAKLLKTKDALLADLADIDAELSAFGTGESKGARRGRPAAAKAKAPKAPRAARGALKETIITLLKAAGPAAAQFSFCKFGEHQLVSGFEGTMLR